jgi:hypothetical protein
MKKLILPLVAIAFIACSKSEDDATKTDPNAQVEVTKANLVGTWSINKLERYTIPGDSMFGTMNFNSGEASLTLGNDDKYTTITPFGNSNGSFTVVKSGTKTYLITIETGDPADTAEILSLTKSALITSDKQQGVNSNDDEYGKTYLSR